MTGVQAGFFPEIHRYAAFSPCRTWRYTLKRIWDPDKPLAMFVGLNPSTADETKDDPTIRRCIRFARDWSDNPEIPGQFGGLVMCNLFAFRATDPRKLKAAEFPVGPDNDTTLTDQAALAGVVIAAWGVHGDHRNRAQEVVDSGALGNFAVLGLTNAGHPRHPLYLRADCKPLNPITLAPR